MAAWRMTALGPKGTPIMGHEFHHSEMLMDGKVNYAIHLNAAQASKAAGMACLRGIWWPATLIFIAHLSGDFLPTSSKPAKNGRSK